MANWLFPLFVLLFSLGCLQKGFENQDEDFMQIWLVIFALAAALLGKALTRWVDKRVVSDIRYLPVIDTRELSSVICHARNDWYRRFEQEWLLHDEGPDCDEHIADSIKLYLTGKSHEQ